MASFREREAATVNALSQAQLDAVRSAARHSLASIAPGDLGRIAFPYLLNFEQMPLRPSTESGRPKSALLKKKPQQQTKLESERM